MKLARPLGRVAAISFLVACSDSTSPDGAQLEISLRVQRQLPAAYVLRTQVGDRTVEVSAASGTAAKDMYVAPGQAQVDVALIAPDGEVLTTFGSVQRFESTTDYRLEGVIGSARPAGVCIEKTVARPLPTAGDTLFLVYAYLPHGVEC